MAAQLERETQALLASLEERVERRMEELRMSLNANVMKKIRLSSADLKVIGLSYQKKMEFLNKYLPIGLDGSCAVSHDDALFLPNRNFSPSWCQRI